MFICVQRFFELWLSGKNQREILGRGGFEVGKEHFPFMVLVQVLWLISCLFEALITTETPDIKTTIFFTILFFIGQSFRIMAMTTLKERWSVRIMILPNEPIKRKGIYSKIRHPNYLGMIIEVFSLPLILGLWKTALVMSILNGVILYIRISCEVMALSNYEDYSRTS